MLVTPSKHEAWIRVGRCRQASRLDDPPSSTVRQQTARYLGMGLANLISILRPEVVALGGGVMGSWEILRDEVLETIDENTATFLVMSLSRLQPFAHTPPSLVRLPPT